MVRSSSKHRVFLDANVLYSAAYLDGSGLQALWKISGLVLVTSSYAATEARRNLEDDRPDAVARLERLLITVEFVETIEGDLIPKYVVIDEKDAPILQAALRAKANFLLTGDKRHFGHLFRKKILGVEILRPAEFLHAFAKPARPSDRK